MGYKCNVMAFFPAPPNSPVTDQVFLSPDTYYDTPLAGKAVMSYPPDADIVESLRYYLEQKDLDRSNTSGCFILPTQAGRRAPWSRLLNNNGMELLKVYSGKDRPFMKLPGGERPPGKALEVWYDPPDCFRTEHVRDTVGRAEGTLLWMPRASPANPRPVPASYPKMIFWGFSRMNPVLVLMVRPRA